MLYLSAYIHNSTKEILMKSLQSTDVPVGRHLNLRSVKERWNDNHRVHSHFCLTSEVTVVKDPLVKFSEACTGTADAVMISLSIVVVDDKWLPGYGK